MKVKEPQQLNISNTLEQRLKEMLDKES